MELYGTSAWSLHTRFGSFRYYEASLNDAAAAASSLYMARLYASPDRGPVRLLYTATSVQTNTPNSTHYSINSKSLKYSSI